MNKKGTKEKKLISVLIPYEVYKIAKVENSWSWSEIIIMGIQSKQNMPNILKRQNNVEDTTERLLNKVNKLAHERFELQEELNKLSNEVLLLKNKNE